MMNGAVVVMAALAVVAPPEVPSAGKGIAKGRVVLDGREPRRPCANRKIYLMKVTVMGQTFKIDKKHDVTTDENGEWSLEVPPGRYVASVVKDLGGFKDSDTHNVSAGATIDMFDNSITEDTCKAKK